MGTLKRYWWLLMLASFVVDVVPLPHHTLAGNLQNAVYLTLFELAMAGALAYVFGDV